MLNNMKSTQKARNKRKNQLQAYKNQLRMID